MRFYKLFIHTQTTKAKELKFVGSGVLTCMVLIVCSMRTRNVMLYHGIVQIYYMLDAGRPFTMHIWECMHVICMRLKS